MAIEANVFALVHPHTADIVMPKLPHAQIISALFVNCPSGFGVMWAHLIIFASIGASKKDLDG